ncbi:ferric-dicitrate binding protein FerR (iron transport regulator) [Dyadobacter sp. BE34]|uniref:Ferric-dicitrate binding protein FerR (Iron transport regulator) n=1 Tax=Dyadobacter fermentans TaxID=94254 RepID=A0ABU1R8G0_9BACT|nr:MULTISPECIES: FecR domain-containing protein [Dyadobacter]MDR6808885.1 ferric-dicitrate binding protein FerR (iron transport regulator) [Dyadobacter fermentans]MDR7046628.1 ferric-dicitrate binding protein FerR (iron transport regulator) [Dyadobacter sp. BE242]MDR7200942.1 ferric-dicitrate binding protein FerR (iron transport regulator) [Dyadobacter sp. BE34]MDR7218902.1 ferric-dicitrate binding protein FerR (iron transport regulator) [Dyadobacter sp. BE31]MDR7264888.1 ferric-dicitrate bind
MPSGNRNKFRSIVARYLSGSADEEESDMIEKYYELFAGKPDRLSKLSPDELVDIRERMKGNITKRIAPSARSRPLLPGFFWRAAAAALILIGAGWVFFLVREQRKPGVSLSVGRKVVHHSVKGQTKFVVLPDGSRVVLHGDTRIEYDRDFNRQTREVSLTGEAYFDVVHLNVGGRKPASFVIKTGKISTTVLGTAFSIKSLPSESEVVVTVTRGKVRVDDGDKHTSLLTANQQVTYNTHTTVADEKIVKSQELTAWVQADMVFQEMPFGDLAETLEKRYGVKISFQNPQLQQCLITGRFSGTETLDEVFKVLTLTSNTKYSLESGELVLSGEGCR